LTEPDAVDFIDHSHNQLTNRMKRLPWLLAACLGGTFILAAGCDRTDAQSNTIRAVGRRVSQPACLLDVDFLFWFS
jgi:hypothetical protein